MITISCRICGSPRLQKNGHTTTGAQKYHCRACGFYGTLQPHQRQRAEHAALAARLALERVSQRAIARILGVSRNTVIALLKKT